MNASSFLAERRVFRAEEFGSALNLTSRSRDSLLAYYRQRGRILPIRRGLYWVVHPGESPETRAFDPFLVAAKMTDDAALAYHTALEFHGRAYSSFSEIQYLTARAVRATTFQGWRFRSVRLPKALNLSVEALFGIEEHDRSRQVVRVTGLERTLVDVLDRPELCGGWEELWRSLEMVEFFDLDQIVEYVLLLDNATTVGKVGWYLELHRETLMVEDEHLSALRERKPRQPRYIDRRDRGRTRFIRQWNLVIPEALAEQRWGEVA